MKGNSRLALDVEVATKGDAWDDSDAATKSRAFRRRIERAERKTRRKGNRRA